MFFIYFINVVFMHNIMSCFCKPSLVMINDLTEKEKAQIIKFLVGLNAFASPSHVWNSDCSDCSVSKMIAWKKEIISILEIMHLLCIK